MKQIIAILSFPLFIFTFFEPTKGQTTIAEQDFDSKKSWGYTTSISTFDNGWNSAYFDIIDINSASPLNKPEFSGNIFGENDLNSTNGTSGFATLSFDAVDISSSSNPEISFDYQVKGYNANDDDVRYEVFHDGTGQGLVDLHDGATDPDDSEGSITISVPNTVNQVSLVIYIRNNGQTGYSGFDNFLIAESTLKSEPTNHVTHFNASSNSISSIDLSWTDATGTQSPENYLILVNKSGNFTIPTDGSIQSDDTDFSDGNGMLNVSQGVETVTFTGLQANTKYYFEIFPYTNLITNTDYKTEPPVPSANVSTLEKPDLVLNEILADPNHDANNDGNFDTSEDEFLEFVNIGNSDLDITGWSISDGTERHLFPTTVLKPNQAVVVFEAGTPNGDFGGSIVQTSSTSNLNLNNGGETIRVKNASGQILIEETYSGASNQSKSRNPDLEGSFEDHTTVDFIDNSTDSPGTRVDGYAFHPRVQITGNEGWRMLSTPTSDNKYHDLLHNIWTQCSSGADYNGVRCDSDEVPNVQFYDTATDQFVRVNSLNGSGSTGSMTPGQGFIVYFYSDDDFDGTPDGFPKALEMFGTENSGTIVPTLNTGTDAATLVGNPFLVPIDWDDLVKTNLSETAYVYDHSYGSTDEAPDEIASGVSGSYRAWSSSTQTGSISEGLIAPFQAFWVISVDGSTTPELKIKRESSAKGGSFYKVMDFQVKDDIPKIKLSAESNYMFNEAYLSFSQDGQIGKDEADGYELTPLDYGDYLTLSTKVEDFQMDINNLPLDLYNPVSIPLHVQAFKAAESGWVQMAGEITLSWPEMNNIPSEWKITLTDKKLNRKVDLKNAKNYLFEADGSQAKIAKKKPFSPFNPKPFQKEKAVNDARFLITINPNVPGGLIDDNIPDQFTLEQNYPNPFNPTTNIKFEIEETRDVNLTIYNVTGQKVTTLVNEVKTPGTYEMTWNAEQMASGIYYYRLTSGSKIFIRKMTLIK